MTPSPTGNSTFDNLKSLSSEQVSALIEILQNSPEKPVHTFIANASFLASWDVSPSEVLSCVKKNGAKLSNQDLAGFEHDHQIIILRECELLAIDVSLEQIPKDSQVA